MTRFIIYANTVLLCLGMSMLLFQHFVIFPISPVFIECAIGLILIFINRKNFEKKIYIRLIIIATAVHYVCSTFSNNALFNNHWMSILFLFPFANIIFKDCYNRRIIIGFTYIFYIFLIISNAYIQDGSDASRNFISVLSLFFLFPSLISYYNNDKNIENHLFILVILNLVVAFVYVGRSGIISGLFLFLFFFGKYIKDSFNSTKSISIMSIMIICFVFGSLFWIISNSNVLVPYLERFSEMQGVSLQEERRSVMIYEYLNKISSIEDLIFGVNLGSCTMISHYDNNPHNSFVFLHAHYGIIGILTIIGCIYKYIKVQLKQTHYLLVMIVSIMIFRSCTDSLFGPSIYDVLLYYMILANKESKKFHTY